MKRFNRIDATRAVFDAGLSLKDAYNAVRDLEALVAKTGREKTTMALALEGGRGKRITLGAVISAGLARAKREGLYGAYVFYLLHNTGSERDLARLTWLEARVDGQTVGRAVSGMPEAARVYLALCSRRGVEPEAKGAAFSVRPVEVMTVEEFLARV